MVYVGQYVCGWKGEEAAERQTRRASHQIRSFLNINSILLFFYYLLQTYSATKRVTGFLVRLERLHTQGAQSKHGEEPPSHQALDGVVLSCHAVVGLPVEVSGEVGRP